MKFHPMILALMAAGTATLASNASAESQMQQGCENMIRGAVAALDQGYINLEQTNGVMTLDKESLDAVSITGVKVIKSSCIGPADCDKDNPDAFTWSANVGKKGGGVHGKVVVSYHRGNCTVEKFEVK